MCGIWPVSAAGRPGPVLAAGTVAARGIATIVQAGVVICICGLKVRAGDLLHGDETGLLTIQSEIATRVAGQAMRIPQDEEEIALFVLSDGFSLDEMRRRYGE
jgi:regulator of RNase E activity RraA